MLSGVIVEVGGTVFESHLLSLRIADQVARLQHLLRVDNDDAGAKAQAVGLAAASLRSWWAVLLLAPRTLLQDKAGSVRFSARSSRLPARAARPLAESSTAPD